MFFRKKKETKKLSYDSSKQKPMLHCSICTGEQVAGFKNLETGKFDDVMLIRGEADLKQFMELYGISDSSEIEKEY